MTEGHDHVGFQSKGQQSIVIRDDIVITVAKVRGDKARPGIEAANEVAVHRKEVYERLNPSSVQPARRVRGDKGTPGRSPRP
jgi:carbon storage regulator CsrA